MRHRERSALVINEWGDRSSDGMPCTYIVNALGSQDYASETKGLRKERTWRDIKEDASSSSPASWQRGFLALLRYYFCCIFLPEGYPHSVSADYLTYQKWDTVQALCSSITGLLCTRALLQGVGVGEATATPAAAAMQWVLRDGAGMVGRIVFAWLKGSELDNNAKTWRLMADILNDIGMTLELLSPLFPQYFLLLACTGSVAKAIVGVAGGATRAAITMHQARANNMADVAAKDGSQETAVSLMGMILGLIITPLVDQNHFLIWSLFFVFTFFHLYANYNAVSGVVMDTLNRQRLAIVLEHYLASGQVLGPNEVCKREKVLWFDGSALPRIELGAKIRPILDLSGAHDLVDTMHQSAAGSEHFVVYLSQGQQTAFHGSNNNKTKSSCNNDNDKNNDKMKSSSSSSSDAQWELDLRVERMRIGVLLHKEASPEASLKGYLVALLMRMRIQEMLHGSSSGGGGMKKVNVNEVMNARASPSSSSSHSSSSTSSSSSSSSLSFVEVNFDVLIAKLQEAGWLTDKTMLGANQWRYTWHTKKTE